VTSRDAALRTQPGETYLVATTSHLPGIQARVRAIPARFNTTADTPASRQAP
jgi:hypothetical protein